MKMAVLSLCVLLLAIGDVAVSNAGVSAENDTAPGTRVGMDSNIFCHWPRAWPVWRVAPEFRVFLRNNRTANFTIENVRDLDANVAELHRRGYFLTDRPVVFVVHGFRDVVNASYMLGIKDGLLALGDFTVFLVGWEKGSYLTPFEYLQAASNSQIVAQVLWELARRILNLDIFHGDKDLLYLYCIGHSLGAHVCGQAGLKTVGLFDRISGLDPAGPSFDNCPTNPSLTSQSADCVDSIHTDGNYSGHVFPFQGSLRRWGFVDFYPNGGVNQPGCNVFTNDFQACSHHRSVTLFIYSLQKPKGVCNSRGPCRNMKSLPDKSCDQGGQTQWMGYYSDCHVDVARSQRKSGVFFLEATATNPFC